MLHKTLSLSESKVAVDDNGSFQGYASTFGNVDSYGDSIIKGAYEKTLAERGLPKMFLNHAAYELPIGKWTDAGEDSNGLFVKGELTPGSTAAQDVHASLKHGTVDGLSIGYHVERENMKTEDGVTYLKEIDLVEVSVVTFPADSHARIDLNSVKFEQMEDIASYKDLERFLREVVGCSKGFSKALLSRVKAIREPVQLAAEAEAKEAQFMAEWRKRLSVTD